MKFFVYHSSGEKGLKKIESRVGTHKKKWVYATKDILTSAIFLAKWGDFQLAFGRVNNGLPTITERYKGAFDEVYDGKSGSVYKLKADNFMENMTSWDEEVVSEKSEEVIEETTINDIKKYLLDKEKGGELIINYYPERQGIPDDDQDLVEKAVLFSRINNKNYTETLIKYHHLELVERYKELLEKGT